MSAGECGVRAVDVADLHMERNARTPTLQWAVYTCGALRGIASDAAVRPVKASAIYK